MFQRLLILETSARLGAVALADANQLQSVANLSAEHRNASDLAGIVQQLLTTLKWEARSIDGVAVSMGPGSFTALRVGLMSAKALAYVNRCPLYGLPTFEVIANQSQRSDKTTVIGDALQGMVFVGRYSIKGATRKLRQPMIVERFSEMIDQLDSDESLTGPGCVQYQSRVAESITVEDQGNWHPRPETMLQMLQRDSEIYRIDPWLAEPMYLRASTAEEKRQRQQSQA